MARLAAVGIAVRRRSRWYTSQPVPPSDQPWYVNGVVAVETALAPMALLDALLAVEAGFGRHRGVPNAARTLDLDLLDYDGTQCAGERLALPHPRLHERRFVLAPLAEIAPAMAPSAIGENRRRTARRSAAGAAADPRLGRSGTSVGCRYGGHRAAAFIVVEPADRYKAALARRATACEASSR